MVDMAIKPKSKKPRTIKHGRPPLSKSHSEKLSSKATRTIIRSHHTLEKQLTQAVKRNDAKQVKQLESAIEDQGGLTKYQSASKLGQSRERGGDSSRVLVEWLQPSIRVAKKHGEPIRLLEVGAISTTNACSKVQCLNVTRIDLHSRVEGIREIDFMDLPIPESNNEMYQIISFSLVLNYVADREARGEMLKRITRFLRPAARHGHGEQLPCVFIVLPLPCIENSRYLTEKLFEEMMKTLGFVSLRIKKTAKLFYSLWRYKGPITENADRSVAKRKEVRLGTTRNNFAITLR